MGLLLAVVLVSLLMTSHGLPRPENEDEANEDEVAAYDEGEKLIFVKKICLCCILLLQDGILLFFVFEWFRYMEEGWREKQRQRSSRLFVGQNWFNSVSC